MAIVYHASDKLGMREFIPRRFWHSADYSRSGNLRDGEVPPPGMTEVSAFYASTLEYLPFYFVPPTVRRLYLSLAKHCDMPLALTLLNIETPSKNLLIVTPADAAKLEAYTFSVYEFDAAQFQRVSGSEYIAGQPVRPLREIVYTNARKHLEERRYQIATLPDLDVAFRLMRSHKISFDAQGRFEDHRF